MESFEELIKDIESQIDPVEAKERLKQKLRQKYNQLTSEDRLREDLTNFITGKYQHISSSLIFYQAEDKKIAQEVAKLYIDLFNESIFD
jgi:flagellar basal body-associated protein FliL